MAPTHVYTGGGCVYPQLAYAGGIAPFTVSDGSTVDFGEETPPADGCWMPVADSAGLTAQLPDNHPDVVAAANAAASAEPAAFTGLRKPQLVAECEARGLDTTGTVADLTARLTAFEATPTTTATDPAPQES